MNKELKELIIEIVSLVVLLIIVVPICVNASSRYREQKDILLSGIGTSVDISHNGDMKKVIIYSNYNKPVKVNLIMKITKFLNDYDIYLDGQVFDIDDFCSTSDEDFYYYKLGVYEVDQLREFDFKLLPKGDVYYDETILYSFRTEGL